MPVSRHIASLKRGLMSNNCPTTCDKSRSARPPGSQASSAHPGSKNRNIARRLVSARPPNRPTPRLDSARLDVKSGSAVRPLLARSVVLATSLLLLAGLTAFVVQPGQAAQPRVLPKVTIGDRTINEGTIARAIEQCADHVAGSALADCLDRFFVVRWLLDRQVEEQKL